MRNEWREKIEAIIDDLETESDVRMKRFNEQGQYVGDNFDWGFAEGLVYAVERLQELIE